jgi:hypothetical protein
LGSTHIHRLFNYSDFADGCFFYNRFFGGKQDIVINNKKLFLLAVSLIPLVVISFILKDKTNFILSEKDSPIIYIKTLYDGEV